MQTKWIIGLSVVAALVIIMAGVYGFQNSQLLNSVRSFKAVTAVIPQVPLPKVSEAVPTTTIIAVGDIMLSRNVAAKMRDYGNDYPFTQVTDFLSSADIAFGNLETPITTGPIVMTGSFSFHANPGTEVALQQSGIDIVSLANNHTPNYGTKGLKDTVQLLDNAGIYHAGAGDNLADALKPAIIERNGVHFAFLAFNDTDVVPPGYGASAKQAGTALMSLDNLQTAMKQAKEAADVIIVSMHSGTEYTATANKRQIDFAHAAIDAGADVVIGSHPHVVQNIEQYKGKYIFYSLGNFIFDQMFSEETKQGLAVKLFFTNKDLKRVELYPIRIEDYAQPYLISPGEATSTMMRLKQPVDVLSVGVQSAAVLK